MSVYADQSPHADEFVVDADRNDAIARVRPFQKPTIWVGNLPLGITVSAEHLSSWFPGASFIKLIGQSHSSPQHATAYVAYETATQCEEMFDRLCGQELPGAFLRASRWQCFDRCIRMSHDHVSAL